MTEILKHIILFAKTINPGIGGMEVHQREFMKRCRLIVTTDSGYSVFNGKDSYLCESHEKLISVLLSLLDQYHIQIFFFNDLSFVKDFRELKAIFPWIRFVFRSGGNDILRAPWGDDAIALNIRQENVCTSLKAIDTLIVNSDFSYLRNVRFGIPPCIMKKIRGGIDYYLCNRNKKYSRELSRRIRDKYLCGDRKILMFACRFKKFKGIENFLEVFLKYSRRKEFFLFIIGEGDTSEEIKRILEVHKDDIYAVMLGKMKHTDTLKYISAADYLVNTSIEYKRQFGNQVYIHTETMGRTMMEALLEGVPVIATNVGGTKELFQETKNAGYLIDSFEELPMVFSQILKEDGGIKHEIVTPDYSWQAIFKSYENIFEGSRKNVMVLDLDDTLIVENSDVKQISRIIADNKEFFFLIINTARILTPELKHFSDILHADYLIASNGMNIIGSDNEVLWDENTGLIRDTIKQADEIIKVIKHDMPEFEIKKTHPHMIQIRSSKGFKLSTVQRIESILKETDFVSVYHEKMMKVLSRYVSKEAALDFILKDLNYSKVYSAGNNLNDYLFVRNADYGWMATEYSSLLEGKDNIGFFEKENAGINLLNRIIDTIKTTETSNEHHV